MNRCAELEKLEDEIRDAVNWHFGTDWDDMDASAVYVAADTTLDGWDGDGWYEVMVGGHTWGHDDAHYYGDRGDLGATVYSAIGATSTWDSHDCLSTFWVYKVTDPDDVAELEALYA